MKKTYIAPESKLYAINMSENIAISGGISEVTGGAVIKFTQMIDGCRGYYTGDETAPVTVTGNDFLKYFEELKGYNNFYAYFYCFDYKA